MRATKGLGLFLLLLVQCCFAPTYLLAQDLPPDDGGFDIETVELPDGGLWGQFNQFVSGSLGTVQADGDVLDRDISVLELDFNIPASDRFQTVLSLDAIEYDLTYTQDLRANVNKRRTRRCDLLQNAFAQIDDQADDGSDMIFYAGKSFSNAGAAEMHAEELLPCPDTETFEPELLPTTREFEVTGDDVDMREAYLQWQASDYATLRVGRQIMVWGQLEYLSPVAFLAPTRTTNTSFRANKAELGYGQDSVQLSLFPLSNVELQLIHAPEMRIDPSLRDSYGGFDSFSDGIVYAEGHTRNMTEPEISDYDFSVARLVYFGTNTTVALTAVEGVNALYEPVRDVELVRHGQNGANCTNEDNNEAVYCFSDDKGRQYTPSTAYGLELSQRLTDKWTLRFEHTQSEYREALDSFRPIGRSIDVLQPEKNNSQTDATILPDAIIGGGKGRFHIDREQAISALSFLYEGDIWNINLQLVALQSEPLTTIDENLDEADKAEQRRLGSTVDEDDAAFPMFHVTRSLGAEEQGYFGVGSGAFFNAYGFGIFGGWTFAETLQIGAMTGISLEISENGPADTEFYHFDADNSIIAQIGVSYLF